VSEVTVAKAYRLLRAIFNTALDDGLIRRHRCRIKGADRENSPERPVLTVAQVYALADAVGLRYRALILLAAFTSLRWTELAELRPGDIDLDACTVRVTRIRISATRVWLPALAAVGLEGVHPHDLRHTGNQLTANLKELMTRIGHDSERAHLPALDGGTSAGLADAVGATARAELARSRKRNTAERSGTRMARNRRPAAGTGE
jgi:integrase